MAQKMRTFNLNVVKKSCSFIIFPCLLSLMLLVPNICAADKVVELRYSVSEGPQSQRTINGYQKWVEAVEKASNGGIKVLLFPSATLAGPRQKYDSTILGLVDVGTISIGHYPGRFPLTDALTFPGSGISNPRMATEIIMDMYDSYPQIQEEFKDVEILFLFGFAPIAIATTNKPVRSWEDLTNLRLRVGDQSTGDYLRVAGVAPIHMGPPDIFLALQRNTIDGNVMGWGGQQAFGITRIANYFTISASIPGPFFAQVMNKRKFESLSQNQKDALLSVSGRAGAQIMIDAMELEVQTITKSIIENKDQEIIYLSEDENRRWANHAAVEQGKLIEALEKRNLPIRKLVEDVKSLAAQKGSN